VKVEAAAPGGVAVTNDNLMFLAPVDGYQQEWLDQHSGQEGLLSPGGAVKFYLRMADGNYAAMDVRYSFSPDTGCQLTVIAYVSRSSSRNLEYDQEKRINPR
jgi:hypothetical protein